MKLPMLMAAVLSTISSAADAADRWAPYWEREETVLSQVARAESLVRDGALRIVETPRQSAATDLATVGVRERGLDQHRSPSAAVPSANLVTFRETAVSLDKARVLRMEL